MPRIMAHGFALCSSKMSRFSNMSRFTIFIFNVKRLPVSEESILLEVHSFPLRFTNGHNKIIFQVEWGIKKK